MAKFFNRVKVTITSTGTGSVTCGTALAGFQSLADASVANADVVRYTIIDGNSYESGTGTVTLSGSTYSISRGPSVSSESNNSAIDVTANASLFLTMLAEDVVVNLADLDNVSTATPSDGQRLAYNASSGLWEPSSPAGLAASITTVANQASLPASPSTKDLAFTADTKALYIYDGAEWDRIYTDTNAVPEWTTSPPATGVLASDGTATVQTVVASDQEGFTIEYSYDTNPSNQAQATISQANNVFTITPSTTVSDAGEFTLRYKATDGLHTTARSALYTLGFFPQVGALWGHWDMGNSSSYSGTGTTWSDLSGNNRDLTWTNVGGTAGYKSSGNLSVPVWETGTNQSQISYAVATDVKTILFIFDPLVDPVASDFQQIFLSVGPNTYTGYFDNVGGGMVGGTNAHSGLTAEYLVNGNSNPSPTQGQAHLEQNKFNSFFMRNYNVTATWTFFQYQTSGYNQTMQLRAIAMWDVSLTDAEMEMAHNSYPQMATWDG